MKKLLVSTLAALFFVSMSSAAFAGAVTTPAFNVTVNLTSACTVTTPGAIILNYTSLGAAVGPVSSAYSVTCTGTLPYTMTTDVASAAAVGITYTIATSAAGGTGNGAAQAYTVDAAITAGQAGTCALASCSATNTHTVTVAY